MEADVVAARVEQDKEPVSLAIGIADVKQEYLGVRMEELTRITPGHIDTDIVRAFMGKVQSKEARDALMIADGLSDMILFHKRVRENGDAMMMPWEDD